MGICLREVNHDLNFAIKGKNAIVVNDLDPTLESDREKLESRIITKYDTQTFSIIPQCNCGYYKNEFKVNEICPICGTPVKSHTDRPIEPEVWIRVPDGVEYFISPSALIKITNAFITKRFDPIRFMLDRGYSVSNMRINPLFQSLSKSGIERGPNSFYHNFDAIIERLSISDVYKGSIQYRIQSFLLWLNSIKDRNLIFCKHLPIPNKISSVIEKTAVGNYAFDKSFSNYMEAVNTIKSLKTQIEVPSLRVRENKAVKAMYQLKSHYEYVFRNDLSLKHGWFRKHIFGCRTPFSARCVITSITEPHDYDELHLPYAASLVLLEPSIKNVLLKQGSTAIDIDRRLNRAKSTFDRGLYDIMNKLIEYSPYTTMLSSKPGLPCDFQRNPSLKRGSAQFLLITKIKDNLLDNSIGISVLILKSPNADFDGDQMNLTLLTDRYQVASFSNLAPHNYFLDLSRYYCVSNVVKLPKQALAMFNRLALEERINYNNAA